MTGHTADHITREPTAADSVELPLCDGLTLKDVGLRLICEETGTSLEFICKDGQTLRLRVNDLGEQLNRHEAQILRSWSAEQQARRRL